MQDTYDEMFKESTRKIIATATDVIVSKALVMVFSNFALLGKASFSAPLSDDIRDLAVEEALAAVNPILCNSERFNEVDAVYVRERTDEAWVKATEECKAKQQQ